MKRNSVLISSKVARQHYLANYNFEKYEMPSPGDEAMILRFMTSVFVKQSFVAVYISFDAFRHSMPFISFSEYFHSLY
jgi:hypothetical protein